MDTLIAHRPQKDMSKQLLAATATRRQRGCGCEETHHRGGMGLRVVDRRGGGGGTPSSASAGYGSVEWKHQPFLVLLGGKAHLSRPMAVPLSFNPATTDATVGNQHPSPSDSGRNHTRGMVEELKLSQGMGTQPADAVVHPRQIKNQ